MDIRLGDIVYGESDVEKYKVIEFIGSGAFGQVFKLARLSDNQFFALKTISTTNLDNTALNALINEGKLAADIKHPNVVSVFFFHDGLQYPNFPPYIIMEFIEGGNTLQKLLDNQRKSKIFFDQHQLVAMLLQLAEGMKAINAQLIHRDIKPDNILLANGLLKISDFGLSKVVGAATRTLTFKGIQHIRYMAPEAWKFEANTIQMDIYSMGIVFYELATLSHPYVVEPKGDIFEAWKEAHFFQVPELPHSKNPSLDIGLSQLIMKMIAKKPTERYSSWDEIIERIKKSEVHEMKKIDVSSLVRKAVETQQKEESKRLRREKEQREREERWKFVLYAFKGLRDSLNEIVETFNKSYDYGKLVLKDTSSHSKMKVLAVMPNDRKVELLVEPVYEALTFKTQRILAWGYFCNSNGKGFNVILVAREADLYGDWLSLYNTHSTLAQRRDSRPDPFPFTSFSEFREKIHHVSANRMDIYQTSVKAFSKDMLVPLFEDIL